ncbi:MAG: ATP-grasp domain-containing protein [Candidatus Saccharimonadales bacterium]
MKLLEYEAKKILAVNRVVVPKSFIAVSEPAFLPVVLKSQVPIGGRGKAGGIVIAKTNQEYRDALTALKKLDIKGFIPKTLLAEKLLDIDRELYLSYLIDRKTATITIMAHSNGGVEVEDNPEDSYFRIGVESWELGVGEKIGEQLAEYYDIPGQTFALQDLVEKLYKTFVKEDMTLLEINPLVLTKDGELIAGDAKVVLDDSASFRHPEWHFETEKAETNFVTLDPQGTVATVANGAGLAMATVDAVADAGLTPANFLDIGGGANEASIMEAFKRIMEYPNINVIIINIFAGITRCDEVARAIISAKKQLPNLPTLNIRLAGTNYEQAEKLLSEQEIGIHVSLKDAIKRAKEVS